VGGGVVGDGLIGEHDCPGLVVVRNLNSHLGVGSWEAAVCTCASGMGLCAVFILFTVFTVFTVVALGGVGCRAMYNCVGVDWELGGGYHREWRVGRLCPRGLFVRIGDMRHRSS
jgi:hypothetical protein